MQKSEEKVSTYVFDTTCNPEREKEFDNNNTYCKTLQNT